ncbi:TPA: hypothetical protein ACXN3T_001279 [Proteus mirabilis]
MDSEDVLYDVIIIDGERTHEVFRFNRFAVELGCFMLSEKTGIRKYHIKEYVLGREIYLIGVSSAVNITLTEEEFKQLFNNALIEGANTSPLNTPFRINPFKYLNL